MLCSFAVGEVLVIPRHPKAPEGPPALDSRESFTRNVTGLSASKELKTGDVVAVASDPQGPWKTEDSEYYAYVQNIEITKAGRRSLGLLWLYRPGDTICKKMPYPFKKELFLSDHCNCGDTRIYEHEAIHLSRVVFFGGPNSSECDFFCRQQYVEGEGAFITLTKDHFRCRCRSPPIQIPYTMGDTILVRKGSGSSRRTLEPAIFVENESDGSGKNIKVRRLLRKGRDYGYPDAAPNEMVFTAQFDILPTASIERPCQIRVFTEYQEKQKQIPHPYNKAGMGDFFFITTQARGFPYPLPTELMPISLPWQSVMKRGWLPEEQPRFSPLRGLDIFCGGGNFGSGSRGRWCGEM